MRSLICLIIHQYFTRIDRRHFNTLYDYPTTPLCAYRTYKFTPTTLEIGSLPISAMTFKDVLTWLGQHGLQDLSRLLALLRVQDVHDVMELTTEQLRDAGWPPSHIVRLRKVTHPLETDPSTASSMIVRRDITPVIPTKRGKIQGAIIASYGTHRKRTHDELTRDFYAPSCHDSRQSNWKTWCTIAEAWGLLPIPITDELVLAVGASLKNGGYRSSKNYFSRAMQEHRDHCINPLPESTLALITRVTRSINRGIGPTTLKDSFELELFHTPLPVDERDPGVWYLHTETARDITTICCWWLLRGIEAAGAKMHHVWRQATSTANTTYFTLPIQKNDTTGMCVSRGHNCVCERNHTNPICPHCAMIRHEKRVRTLFPRSDTVPFIPEPDGSHPAKQTIIDIFRRAIEYTGTQLERPGPDGRGIHRFSEHVCRVSGAQFLTRLGYNIDAVQLIGRWGSDAIKRYIQDSPLMRPQQVTQISAEEHIRTLVKDQMTRSYNQFWIVHSTSGICHIPAIAENCIDNRRWHTVCGWYYGSSTFKKSFNKPTKDRCLKCFRYTEITDVQEIDLSESDEDQ